MAARFAQQGSGRFYLHRFSLREHPRVPSSLAHFIRSFSGKIGHLSHRRCQITHWRITRTATALLKSTSLYGAASTADMPYRWWQQAWSTTCYCWRDGLKINGALVRSPRIARTTAASTTKRSSPTVCTLRAVAFHWLADYQTSGGRRVLKRITNAPALGIKNTTACHMGRACFARGLNTARFFPFY